MMHAAAHWLRMADLLYDSCVVYFTILKNIYVFKPLVARPTLVLYFAKYNSKLSICIWIFFLKYLFVVCHTVCLCNLTTQQAKFIYTAHSKTADTDQSALQQGIVLREPSLT